MEDAGNAREWNAARNDGAVRIDDGDFGIRGGAEDARVRIDVRDIEAAAIGGWGDVACAATGSKALLFRAGLRVEDGDVTRDAVGNEEMLAGTIFGGAGRLRGDRPGGDDCEGVGVDDGQRVVPGVGDEKASAVRRKSEAAGNVPHRNFLDLSERGAVEHADFVALLAEYEEAGAIARKQQLDGRRIVEDLAGSCRADRTRRAAVRDGEAERDEGENADGCGKRTAEAGATAHCGFLSPGS